MIGKDSRERPQYTSCSEGRPRRLRETAKIRRGPCATNLHRRWLGLCGGCLRFAARGGFALANRRLFSQLLEVLLHVLLKNHRHFVTADVAAGIGVRDVGLRIRSLQPLLARRHFHRDLARHVGGALADDLADLTHGGQLFSELGIFVPVLAADAAARLVGGLLIGAVAAALGLRVLAIFALAVHLRICVGGLLSAGLLLLAFRGIAVLALPTALRAGLLCILSRTRRLLGVVSALLAHFRKQVRHGVAQLGHQARVLVGIGLRRLAIGGSAARVASLGALGAVLQPITGGVRSIGRVGIGLVTIRLFGVG